MWKIGNCRNACTDIVKKVLNYKSFCQSSREDMRKHVISVIFSLLPHCCYTSMMKCFYLNATIFVMLKLQLKNLSCIKR